MSTNGYGHGNGNGHVDLGELRERLAMAEMVIAALGSSSDDPDHLQAWKDRRDAARRAVAAVEFEKRVAHEGLHKSTISAKAISDLIRRHPLGPKHGAALFKSLPR